MTQYFVITLLCSLFGAICASSDERSPHQQQLDDLRSTSTEGMTMDGIENLWHQEMMISSPCDWCSSSQWNNSSDTSDTSSSSSSSNSESDNSTSQH